MKKHRRFWRLFMILLVLSNENKLATIEGSSGTKKEPGITSPRFQALAEPQRISSRAYHGTCSEDNSRSVSLRDRGGRGFRWFSGHSLGTSGVASRKGRGEEKFSPPPPPHVWFYLPQRPMRLYTSAVLFTLCSSKTPFGGNPGYAIVRHPIPLANWNSDPLSIIHLSNGPYDSKFSYGYSVCWRPSNRFPITKGARFQEILVDTAFSKAVPRSMRRRRQVTGDASIPSLLP